MTALDLAAYLCGYAASHAAWEAFLADRPMSWVLP